jgi:hypothetical protein
MITELPVMKRCLKFPFSIKTPRFALSLPRDFKFLAVAFQDEQANVWIESVDPGNRVEVNFQLFGTGQDIPVTATYLTTFNFGPFTFHLYRH